MKVFRLVLCAAIIGVWSLGFMPSASAAGQGDSNDAATIKEITELDRKWVEAAAKHDTAYLNQLMAPDFFECSAGSGGEISNKQELFRKVKSPERKIKTLTVDQIKVHVYGDTAILTDRTNFTGTIGGHDMNAHFRVLRVFVKQDGRWRAAAAELCHMAPSVYGKRY
ncbi:MAG: nuclear transport factor 2 family protein [Terriglobia bacterium]